MSGLSPYESRRVFSVMEDLNLVIGFPWDNWIRFKLTNEGSNQLQQLMSNGANAFSHSLNDEQSNILDGISGKGMFIVHSDNPSKSGFAKEVQAFIVATTGIEPKMLQPTPGQPLWEEFERHASNCGIAICIWSPDRDNPESVHIRPNVLLETGYFLSRLPKGNVLVIKEDERLIGPSDLAGIVWANKDNWRELLPGCFIRRHN